MAGQKISLLAPVAQILPTDMFIVARGGGTYKMYGSSFATTPQFEALTKTVGTLSTKIELENVRSSFASASAATTNRINTIASTYTTTSYVNNLNDQTKVYVDEQARTFNSSLSGYIAKPNLPQIGNNLIWNGTKWIAQDPIPTTINNYALDVTSVGGIAWYPFESPPPGYLECDGSSISREQYPELFAAIGTRFGSVDSNHFNLPDLRGEFIRGWDHGRGIDPGRALGSLQMDALSAHSHGVTTNVDTLVYTLVDTNVDTGLAYNLEIDINTDVATNVDTFVNTNVATNVTTTVSSNVAGDVTTNVNSLADTTVSTTVSTDTFGEFNLENLSATNIAISATYQFPVNLPYASPDETGTFNLSAGTGLAFLPPEPFTITGKTDAQLEGQSTAQLSSVSIGSSTAVTTVTSTGTSNLSLTAISTAVSNATSTAVSMATSTAVSMATSVATPILELTATSTAFSLATSTAVSMATSVAFVNGFGTETRPRNRALLPCIKYTSFIATTGLTNTLSAYIPKPANSSVGKVLGYNGTSWIPVNGLPLTAALKQFLTWDGAAWVAGDYPSNLITHYSNTLILTEGRNKVEILDIPSTAKKLTLILSQIGLSEGNNIKIRLGTGLGTIASNYKSNATVLGTNGQQFLNSTDSFGLFGTVSYVSPIPNSLLASLATVVSGNVDCTITLTKTESNTWVFASTGSLDNWTMIGSGSVVLPAILTRVELLVNSGAFSGGKITLYWE